jgi:uncharacterized phage-associated protein
VFCDDRRSCYVLVHHLRRFALTKPVDPRAVANLLLKEARGRGQHVSNLKLQKLLFLCHALYLVHTGRPLVRGSFEAWQYGPVHREVYDAFKNSRAEPITEDALRFDPVTGMRQPIALPADRALLDVVQKVVQFYGDRSPGELVNITHAKDGPWDHVVSTAKTHANMALKISDEVIAERFKYLWFGKQPNFLDKEPDEDAPLVA